MKYTFRILIDYEKDVFRDIEMSSEQRFLDLHQAILDAFEFSGEQMASFYMSNEDWDKGEEIMQFDMGEDIARSMENTSLGEMVDAVGAKVLYIYDFLRLWIFYLELVAIAEEESGATYPIVTSSIGIPPKEEDKSADFEMPKGSFDEDEELDPELKDLLGGDDDDEDPGHIDPNDLSSYY